MLTVKDLMARYEVPRETIANWYARRVLPDAIRVGGEMRWRVEDIELFEDFLRARHDYRDNGGDPDGPNGPAPPVYSTGCKTFDSRAAVARMEERERQARSKTLAAGTKPIPAEQPVTMPEPSQQDAKQNN
jgi:hypothetical protein